VINNTSFYGGIMIIREYELFDGFDNRVIDELMSVTTTHEFAPGEMLFRQGDKADGFYILQKGSVELGVSGIKGVVYLADKIGETIGWSSVAGRDTYSAAAICREPTRVVKFDKAGLDVILRSNPQIGLLFYKRLAGAIGERLIECHHRMARLYEREGINNPGCCR
jgi:CRP/FNR family cyclic AMP-dependent transcriptional regulator